jgi:hypothetical protein
MTADDIFYIESAASMTAREEVEQPLLQRGGVPAAQSCPRFQMMLSLSSGIAMDRSSSSTPMVGGGLEQDSSPPEDSAATSDGLSRVPIHPPNGRAAVPPGGITRSTVLFCFCAAVNSANLGYDIGVSTGAGKLVQQTFNLSVVQREVFLGSMNFWSSTLVGLLVFVRGIHSPIHETLRVFFFHR